MCVCVWHTYTHTHTHTYIYIYIYTRCIRFQTFFVWAFKIVVDSWKFTTLLLYILWDDWPIFMISASNEQLQQQLEYTLLKPDCHSWWISKMQYVRQRVQEEILSEKASTLQIGSVAFPPGQCTSPQLHPCDRLFDQDGHQDSSPASLKSRRWSLWLLVIP